MNVRNEQNIRVEQVLSHRIAKHRNNAQRKSEKTKQGFEKTKDEKRSKNEATNKHRRVTAREEGQNTSIVRETTKKRKKMRGERNTRDDQRKQVVNHYLLHHY